MKRAAFLTNPHAGTSRDGTRRHDQSWSDLNSRDEFRAFTGILNAALWGALVWAALACFVVILWGVMA
jgi:hypothetical protein